MLVVFEVSFVKNNVCDIFNGIEGDVFHELFEFMLVCQKNRMSMEGW